VASVWLQLPVLVNLVHYKVTLLRRNCFSARLRVLEIKADAIPFASSLFRQKRQHRETVSAIHSVEPAHPASLSSVCPTQHRFPMIRKPGSSSGDYRLPIRTGYPPSKAGTFYSVSAVPSACPSPKKLRNNPATYALIKVDRVRRRVCIIAGVCVYPSRQRCRESFTRRSSSSALLRSRNSHYRSTNSMRPDYPLRMSH